ncbi:uncharacterized protein BDZ99DRAFT_519069 [Mytilinidion resinicola]|uniref:Uncharacterized protein n=1 Tax=Mytilinidion resinicola TaxID=574789 RepID=A0A6A6YV04_9PEZI|nr:uncharacterized protein BDZ99DRAFT_519069 [Mytilinidion resinicola]KAF2811824.1 hypothetical protein BDZ99DRAFT_519069 [Mytilinidion resinicola]
MQKVAQLPETTSSVCSGNCICTSPAMRRDEIIKNLQKRISSIGEGSNGLCLECWIAKKETIFVRKGSCENGHGPFKTLIMTEEHRGKWDEFWIQRQHEESEERVRTNIKALIVLAQPIMYIFTKSAMRNALYLWIVSTIIGLGQDYATAWGVFNTIPIGTYHGASAGIAEFDLDLHWASMGHWGDRDNGPRHHKQ